MEKRVEVKTILVRLMCDECGHEMNFTGECLTSYPPQYPHKCCNCPHKTNVLGHTYPYTENVEIVSKEEK